MLDAIPIEAAASAWPWLRWPLAAGLLFAGIRLAYGRLKIGQQGEARVRAVIARAGQPALHDVLLPTPRGGLTQVDHLVLLPDGVLVIETKNMAGMLYGAAGHARWFQKTGRQGRNFRSPLLQNGMHQSVVRSLLPGGARVDGMVVFAGKGRFPRGWPMGTCSLGQLRDSLAHQAGPASPEARNAWRELKRVARTDRAARRRHLRGIQRRHGRGIQETLGWCYMGAGLSIATLSILWS